MHSILKECGFMSYGTINYGIAECEIMYSLEYQSK